MLCGWFACKPAICLSFQQKRKQSNLRRGLDADELEGVRGDVCVLGRVGVQCGHTHRRAVGLHRHRALLACVHAFVCCANKCNGFFLLPSLSFGIVRSSKNNALGRAQGHGGAQSITADPNREDVLAVAY